MWQNINKSKKVIIPKSKLLPLEERERNATEEGCIESKVQKCLIFYILICEMRNNKLILLLLKLYI